MNELKSKVVTGIFWLVASSSIVQFLRLIIKVILARLLFPSDFGIIAIALIIITALNLFKNLGINAALIYRQKNIKKAFDTAFCIILILGVFLTILGYLSAPFVANFFGNHLIKPILRVLSFTILISSLGILPQIMINKQLLFKKGILPEISSMAIFGLVSVTLAFLGFGVWSLVLGQLADSFSKTILYWVVSPFKPSFKFDWIVAKELLSYGRHVLGAGIVLFLIRNLDNIVIGKILGSTLLGFYVLAYTVANLIATEITHIMGKVAFPAYSIIQNDKRKLRKAYLKILKFISLLSFPMAVGMFILAPEIVIVLFGKKWIPMVPVLMILCFYGMMRSIGTTTGSIFYAVGKPSILKKLTFVYLIMTVLIIYPLTVRYGIFGTGIAVFIPIFLIQFLAFYEVSKIINVKCFVLWRIILFPFIVSLAMSGLIFFVKNLISISLLNLIVLVFLGILFYSLVIFLFKPELFYEIKDLMKLIYISNKGDNLSNDMFLNDVNYK